MSLRALCFFVSILCLPVAQAEPPDSWQFKEWTQAIAQVNDEKKPLFVLFGYADCPWCEYLYRRGMNDTEVRAKYKQNFVVTYVDTKSHRPEEIFVLPGGATITHGDLIKRFQAYPTPSWIFLSPSGSVLHSNRNGKTTAREMLRDIDFALAKR